MRPFAILLFIDRLIMPIFFSVNCPGKERHEYKTETTVHCVCVCVCVCVCACMYVQGCW